MPIPQNELLWRNLQPLISLPELTIGTTARNFAIARIVQKVYDQIRTGNSKATHELSVDVSTILGNDPMEHFFGFRS